MGENAATTPGFLSVDAPVTRLAPSPTGALHLGNARTFLVNWAMARKNGWRIVLRIEDLDTPRVKAGAAEDLMEILRWLGMDWDEPVVGPREVPLVQSRDLEPYRAAMRVLAERGLAYPCELTRTQIEAAASAPQEGSHETAFPRSLRPEIAGAEMDFDVMQSDARQSGGSGANWRFVCPEGTVEFEDGIAGARAYNPSEIVGDFILWTKRDQPSYQLAVVVDDERQGVNRIVRGDDLLDSVARQVRLREALGEKEDGDGLGRGLGMGRGLGVEYWHLPLVIGADGKRLAKRHGDTRVEMYREKGVSAEAIIGLVAYWSIPGAGRRAMSAAEFRDRFDPATMSRMPVVFTQEDDAWLLSREAR